jgi:hypothetical protein
MIDSLVELGESQEFAGAKRGPKWAARREPVKGREELFVVPPSGERRPAKAGTTNSGQPAKSGTTNGRRAG